MSGESEDPCLGVPPVLVAFMPNATLKEQKHSCYETASLDPPTVISRVVTAGKNKFINLKLLNTLCHQRSMT